MNSDRNIARSILPTKKEKHYNPESSLEGMDD